MRARRAGLLPGFLLMLWMGSAVEAAELKIIAGGGITAPLREIAAQFERMSGHKVSIFFGTTPELIKEATSGEPFDVGVAPREVFGDAGARARFVAGPTTDVARVGLGVAVRAGAPKPDISTPDKLKQTLVKAQSIATIPASAAGAQIMRLFDRLGIADVVKPKLKALPGPAPLVEALAKGEAEIGIFLANVLTAPGLELVGPFPAELQSELVYTTAVAANAADAEGARLFIAFLQSGAAQAVIKAKGMVPVTR